MPLPQTWEDDYASQKKVLFSDDEMQHRFGAEIAK